MGEEDAKSEVMETVMNGTKSPVKEAGTVVEEKENGVKDMEEDKKDENDGKAEEKAGDEGKGEEKVDEGKEPKEEEAKVEEGKEPKGEKKDEEEEGKEEPKTEAEEEKSSNEIEKDVEMTEKNEDLEEKDEVAGEKVKGSEEKMDEEKENDGEKVEGKEEVMEGGEEKDHEENDKEEVKGSEKEEEDEKIKEDEEEKGNKEEKPSKKRSRGKGADKKKKVVQKELEPRTPTIDRPVRERKSVERLVATIEKDNSREFHIEKGRGTPLKEIPNGVAWCMDWSLKPCTATYTTVWDVQNHNVIQVLVDRLTSLPDELLIRILSLLPTKDAAATSVLSRRLRRVFPLLTSLDLDISPISLCLKHPDAIERFPTFVSFVDTLLQAHQSQYLTKFRLHVNSADFNTTYFYGCNVIGCKQGCLPHLKSPGLYAWISYPLNLCGLRVLDLRILVREPCNSQLPPAIFTCETLEVLKLEVNLGLDQVFTMPSYCLPNLKLLLLSGPFIYEDGFLPRLVSSCPVLEDLTFEPFTNHVNITAITSTSLRRLCLRMLKWPDFQEDNSDFVLINTPNLEYLEYRDNLAECYSVPAMHCLVKAVLRIERLLESDEVVPMIEVMLSLIRPLSYAQHISLCSLILEEFDYVDEKVLKDQLPVFPNMKHLELGGGGTDYYWNKLLLPLLNCSPVLETLVFAEGLTKYYSAEHAKYGGSVEHCSYRRENLELEQEFFSTDYEIPLCCRYRLKRIEIKKYYGLGREVGMIQFLLRHALVLEELVICLSQYRTPNQMSVENTLNNLPKASVTCSIKVL